jgi:aspartate/methionine/tyrosine aminotransferase
MHFLTRSKKACFFAWRQGYFSGKVRHLQKGTDLMHTYKVTLTNQYGQRISMQIQASSQYAAERAAEEAYTGHTVVAVRRVD